MHIANTKLLIIVTLELLWTTAESQQFFHQVCYSLNWKKKTQNVFDVGKNY